MSFPKVPANTQLAEEIALFEAAERNGDAALIQKALAAQKEAQAQIQRDLTARARKRSSKKRKAPVLDTDNEPTTGVVSATDLEEFGKLIGQDKRGSKKEREDWPELMSLVSFSSLLYTYHTDNFSGLYEMHRLLYEVCKPYCL